MPDRVLMNALYADATDGTGTWTRAVMSALPTLPAARGSFDPMRAERVRFYRKVLYEIGFRHHRARLRVHPYAATSLDRKAALVILNDAFDEAHATGWHADLSARSIAMADRLATISQDQQRRLERTHGRPFSLLTPFPDDAFFSRPPAPGQGSPGRVTAAYWGGWHDRKGMRALLDAMPPSGAIHFHVTGSPPPEIAGRPDVTVEGRLTTDDLVALIDRVDVAVYPSHDEGFGLPPYESLLRGTPVVARALPSYRDFVRPGSRGFLAFARDHDAAHAIHEAARIGRVDPAEALATPTLGQARTLLAEQLTAWLA